MKKIVMLFVAAAMAGMVGAAQFDWKLQVGADYAGQTVYALSGTTAAAILAVCQGSDAAAWESAFAGFTGISSVGSGSRAAAAGITLNIEGNDNLVFVIVDGAIAADTRFAVLNDYTMPEAYVYTPPTTGETVTLKLADLGVAGNGTFKDIPEPTSGLLLLLGGAMLALRRKQK